MRTPMGFYNGGKGGVRHRACAITAGTFGFAYICRAREGERCTDCGELLADNPAPVSHGAPCLECGEDHEDAAYTAECERHDGCREFAVCGSSIIEHEYAQSGSSSPAMLAGLLLALVPVSLVVVFVASLAGAVAGVAA